MSNPSWLSARALNQRHMSALRRVKSSVDLDAVPGFRRRHGELRTLRNVPNQLAAGDRQAIR